LTVNLLCIGDVVGRPGRTVVANALPHLVKRHDIHCVIANVENAANGSGLTEALYKKFLNYGVNLMTLGDHIYRRAEIMAEAVRRALDEMPAAEYEADESVRPAI